ncbi:MAG: DNA polymerase III subunit alpha [Candidatus Moraniibacteriota bacterium]|nr:MAG: DNA polymerase III subunit alpha [Candidatus Moranbacteria bacterium]
MPFAHLHVHSHYSLLTAPAKIDALLDRAKALGMEALALTDYSALYGAVELSVKAKERGMKAIIGAEIYVAKDMRSRTSNEDRRRYNLVLLAENEVGYKNLMKIISASHLEGFYYKPRADKALLRTYREGLIALSGSVTGEVPSLIIAGSDERATKAAREYESIFGAGNFFLELQPHRDYENQLLANAGLVRISQETGIPLVAANDVHYVHPEEAELQDILLCIQNNWKVSDENRLSLRHLDLSLRSPEEMRAFFEDVPDAFENAARIADRCDVHIKLGETQLPHFDVPEGKTAEVYLRELCEQGLVKRFGDRAGETHRARMEYELGVIEKTGFASYFLIVQDFVNWAKNKGIVVGPGRGSAAGSFVAYLTGITNMDPIEYRLLFERFLNPERISMPDVDMDFSDDRRDDVLNYVREKYGHDHVAQIITFGTMAARAAIRDAGRALGFSYGLCDSVAKLIPQFHTIEKALAEAPDFKAFTEKNPDAKRLVDVAKKIEGLARHASMHACGVVITKDPVTEYTPIQNISGSKEGIVTQYSSSTKSSYIEKIGLLKMDFLGLKNLTIIQDTIKILKALGKFDELGQKIGLDPNSATTAEIIDHLPLDDADTFALLQKARTTGVFQLESNGMKRYLKQLRPSALEDIIAMVALYRPGPMEYIPDFIAGKHGQKTVEYLHPKLEPILGTTYGVAIYQEQVMQIVRDLAGFTLGEADILRKAVGKKIFELIREQKIKFVEGCEKQGISKSIGEKVFAFIEPFAGYGFNRSHAACYALIGYQTAYLKAHYPAEFMAALLTSDQSNSDRVSIEVAEARDIGIEVLPPSVNESFEAFAVIRGEDGIERIRFGLNAVKNVGTTVAEEIVRERKANGPFQNLTDFIERVRGKDLNKKSIEALSKVGALDSFGERKSLLSSIDTILLYAKNSEKAKSTHSVSLFRDMPIETSEIRIAPVPEATKREKLQWEKELLGLYVSDHPASDYEAYLAHVALPIHEVEKHPEGASTQVGGVISALRKAYTKDQKTMYFATIEDTTGRIEAVVFPRVAEQTESLWVEEAMVIAGGKISLRDGSPKIMVERAERLSPASVETWKRVALTRKKHEGISKAVPPQTEDSKPSASSITVSLPDTATETDIEMLATLLRSLSPGDTRVFIELRSHVIRTAFTIASDRETLDRLRASSPMREIR